MDPGPLMSFNREMYMTNNPVSAAGYDDTHTFKHIRVCKLFPFVPRCVCLRYSIYKSHLSIRLCYSLCRSSSTDRKRITELKYFPSKLTKMYHYLTVFLVIAGAIQGTFSENAKEPVEEVSADSASRIKKDISDYYTSSGRNGYYNNYPTGSGYGYYNYPSYNSYSGYPSSSNYYSSYPGYSTGYSSYNGYGGSYPGYNSGYYSGYSGYGKQYPYSNGYYNSAGYNYPYSNNYYQNSYSTGGKYYPYPGYSSQQYPYTG